MSSESDSDAVSDFNPNETLATVKKVTKQKTSFSACVDSESEGLDSVSENLNLNGSDLVWGKIRSYPWWPGQVLNASFASHKAKKHFKEGKSLVAYFGDGSFAWNDVTMIKPFHEHFAEMVNQSDSKSFREAVDCALGEVSRRVEFGLSCGCVLEEGVKSQEIVNTGIREDLSVRYGGDELSSGDGFEVRRFVGFVKELACLPRFDASEELLCVTTLAQLLAFQQWNCNEFGTFVKSVELEPDTDEAMLSKKQKTDYKDDEEEKSKEETLLGLTAKKCFESESDGKLKSEKKRKVVESSESGKSKKKIKSKQQVEDSASQNSDEEENLSVSEANIVQKNTTTVEVENRSDGKLKSEKKRTVVESSESSKTKKKVKSKQQTSASQNTDEEDSLFLGDANKLQKETTTVEAENKKTKKPEHEELAEGKISSSDEMLSSLRTAKIREEIPESVSMDHSNYDEFDMFLKDIACSNIHDDFKNILQTEDLASQMSVEETHMSVDDANKLQKKGSITETGEPTDVKDITGSEEQTGLKDCSADSKAPNALVLLFADSDTVPSEEKLNSIFNRYGPLRESETQVTKKGKRARVVFKRAEDAKTAFSSAGKYSIFGPSLLSYKLKYVRPKAEQSKNMTN